MTSAALKIIRYPDLVRWDVKYFLAELECKYPLVPLADLVEEHNEKVKPFLEPDKTFRILGVNNTGGIFHAYDSLGKKIKQPYKKVNAGDFAYNPYRINVGSIGLVPPEHDGAYISPAYVVFRVNREKMLPELLLFILKGEFFNELLRAATAGSVRMNLTYDLLRTLKVPVPPMEAQCKAMCIWKQSLEEKDRLMRDCVDVLLDCTRSVLGSLGFPMPSAKDHTIVFATRWKTCERWSTNHNLASRTMVNYDSGMYPVCDLGDIVEYMQYGSSEKANSICKGVPILRMNNLVDGDIDFSDMKHLDISGPAKEALVLREGDILLNRTNSKELVGKCAVFHSLDEYVFASYLIRIRLCGTKALPDYIAFLVNSPLVRRQIDAMSRQIIGQANINTEELRSLRIPLPPLAIQHELIRDIFSARRRAAQLRMQARESESSAQCAVAKCVLGRSE
jgi:type I restriction enzyme, S subunit